MRKILPLTLLLLLAFAVTAQSQWAPPPPQPARNLNGTWYLNGDPDAPCRIIEDRPDGRARFINENRSVAWGSIRGDDIWIPDWSNGSSDGLRGKVRGNRINWVGSGSFWSR